MNDLMLAGKKILYVEDDPFIAGVVEMHLQRAGAIVITVESVVEAKTALEREPFDILLTDLLLPGKENGVTLIRFVRKQIDSAIASLPVVVLTNLPSDALEVQQAAALGVTGFFAKSSTPLGELVQVIACVLQGEGRCDLSRLPITVIPRQLEAN